MDSDDTVTTRLLHQLNDHVPAVDGEASDQEVLAQIRSHSSIRRLQACLILLEGGHGATTTAAIARSLLASAQQVLWETTNDPRPARPLAASLARERRRIIDLAAKHGLSIPNINRWLQPIDLPQLEDISAGVSFPLDWVWADPGLGAPVTAEALGMTAAIAQILDMAGHANAAGSWCTVANPPHPVGYTATATYAAIFLQSASRSAAFATGQDKAPAITRTIDEITRRARSIHEIPAPSQSTSPAASILSISGSPIDAADRVPFFGYPPSEVDHLLEQVLKATDAFMALLEDTPNPYVGAGPSNLRSLLPYLTALDTANTVHMAVRGYLPHEVAPIGARMLLEAAGRSAWMSSASSSVPSDEELMLRYVAVADDETARRATLRRNLTDDAVPAHVIAALLDPLPADQVPAVDLRRTPAHQKSPQQARPFEQMLLLGEVFPEEGRLDLSYSLFSQVSHSTGLGLLHCLARTDLNNRMLSHEMTALAADVACLSTARTVAPLGRQICHQLGFADPEAWAIKLYQAAAVVHRKAQIVHFLD